MGPATPDLRGGKATADVILALDAHGQKAHGAHGLEEMHLPHGSWWPFWLAIAITLLGIGIMAIGQGLHLTPADFDQLRRDNLSNGTDHVLHPQMPGPIAFGMLAIGVLAVVGSLVGWFVQDYKWWQEKVGTGTTIPRAGTLLFISSEVFLFGALFANYFTFQTQAPYHAPFTWPDVQLEGGHAFQLPILKTAIFTAFLFASSGTVHMAEKHLKAGNHRKFVNWWWLTILFGAIFLVGQVLEYKSLIAEGATLGSSQFMTAFFILTGTHGLHVFGGLCILLVMGIRAAKGQFTAERHAGPQVAAMYWHFVDIVWVFVFGILYLMNVHDWHAALAL